MELRAFLRILNRNKMLILFTTVLTVVVVAFGTSRMSPIYSTSALLRIAQPTSDVVSSVDLNYTERLKETYVQILTSRPFLEETRKRLDLDMESGSLADLIKVQAISGTELIRIGVNSSNRQLTAAVANTLSELLIEQGQKVYTGGGEDLRQILRDQLEAVDTQLAEDRVTLAVASSATPASPEVSNLAARIRAEENTYSMLLTQYEKARLEAVLRANSISVIEPAVVPARPSEPSLKLNVALAAAVGLFAGVALAFVYENLLPMLHSADDRPALRGLELVGRIPKLRRRRGFRLRGKATLDLDSSAQAIEPFLALGSSIFLRRSGPVVHTLVISSAEPGAGKSTTVGHLGAALAHTGRRVVLVDGDQRRPTLHRLFGLPLAPGVADAVLDPRVLQRCLRSTSVPGLRVLTAGAPGVDQLAFWQGAKLPELVKQLATQADVVIWDTPPILAAVDAKLLAPFADLFLLVIAEGSTTAKQLDLALEQLRQAGCEAPGIVFNKTKDQGYAQYGYYYRSKSQSRSEKASKRSVEQRTPAPVRQEVQ